jgi:hypothetical protein
MVLSSVFIIRSIMNVVDSLLARFESKSISLHNMSIAVHLKHRSVVNQLAKDRG